MDLVSLISNLYVLCIFGIEKGVVWNAYSMLGRMIVLSILIFCWDEAGERSRITLCFLILVLVISCGFSILGMGLVLCQGMYMVCFVTQ